ncbi:MAG: chemotaxis protein CheD [Clostridiaceae bacterium]|nr:chemotaxis protein CheD [Clostridiaceae bacterium]
MADAVIVGISDLKIVKKPEKLITYALGSCVGICIYDQVSGVSGLSHVLLPDSSQCPRDQNQMKFADTAVPLLVKKMEALGVRRGNMTAKIAGGAALFGQNDIMRIGERNIMAVKQQLRLHQIRLVAEDTGLNYGRTVEFHAADGKVYIKTALHGVKMI